MFSDAEPRCQRIGNTGIASVSAYEIVISRSLNYGAPLPNSKRRRFALKRAKERIDAKANAPRGGRGYRKLKNEYALWNWRGAQRKNRRKPTHNSVAEGRHRGDINKWLSGRSLVPADFC
jgi:hypothetical protein